MLTKPEGWGNVKISACPFSVNSGRNLCFSCGAAVQFLHAQQAHSLNIVIGLVLTAMVVGVVVWARRHPTADGMPLEGPTTPRPNLLQIVLPDGACAAARKLQGARFEKQQAPILPLTHCDNPQTCRCRCKYLTVEDRRSGERRSGDDKRDKQRFEENPRRKDRGRRIADNLWKQDQD